jgi:hypothetical protein
MTAVRLGCAALCTFATLTFAAAAAAEPILGNWTRQEAGGEFQVFQTAPGEYGVRVIRVSSNPCFRPGVNSTHLTGSGLHYSGTVPHTRSNEDCTFVGDGRVQIDLDPSGDSGHFHTDPPDGYSCCSADDTMTRVASELPALVGAAADDLRARYGRLIRSHRRTAINRQFHRLRTAAHRARARVTAFHAVSDGDVQLRGCAIDRLSGVEQAARAHQAGRVRSGVRRVRSCVP